MTTLTPISIPANLRAVPNAQLPAVYERAKAALMECDRLDECKDWADKAMALASYARQADDETLFKTAVKIKARAIRRAGELLREFDGQGKRTDLELTTGDHGKSQREAAATAGLSEHQQLQAVRVANIPEPQFEAAVESEHPPTITALAELGTKSQPKPLVDLKGRDPEDFYAATQGQGAIEDLAHFALSCEAAAVARGSLDHEVAAILGHITTIRLWLDQLESELT